MKSSLFLLAASAASISAQLLPPQPSDCPATPDVDIGAGVEIKPQNVPQGCNAFEVLVGASGPDIPSLKRLIH